MKKTAAHLRIFVFVAAFLAPTLAWAQTGRITGTVLDSSGAAVSGAIISATDTATAVERTASSSTTGAYTIPALSPSVYVVTITKTGFRELKFDNVTLTVDQILTLDAQLSVAPVQSITVEVQGSQVAPLDTQDGTLSNVVEHQQMTELPLILRDPYQLVLLSPGVTQSDGLGGVSVNGARERNNNFLLDGMDNNDADVPGGLGGATSQNPDSTEEFRVLTNNFAPEFGRNNGAIIDVITRSGTNQFHGNLFYFGRWDALGARDFFNHQIDPDTGLVDPKNPYVRNLYGGSFGGPIKKDKTFFFINYQGDRFVTNLTNESTVPTAAFKTGI
ncbi:MAG: carboxypeptidase-like regulatory domain-containing protein, partial [Candidatus Acidiferrales bacterium]